MRDEPTLLVATWRDGLFAVSRDRCTKEISKQSVRGLAPDGLGGTLAIVDRHSLRRRTPNGEWVTLAESGFELSCCMAVKDAIFVGTDDARLLRLSRGGTVLDPIVGFDTIAGRDTWFAGSAVMNGQRLGPPLGVRSVTVNSNATVLLANVHVGGIPRSADDGKTWHPTIDINSDVHEVSAHPTNPYIVAAAAAIGLCISYDAGASWIVERDGLHAPYCSAIAFSDDDILVAASTDHFATQGRIYRRLVGPDRDVVAIENGLPTWLNGIVDTGCIATNGATAAVVDKTGNLYQSTDSGHSWSRGCDESLPTSSSVVIC